MILALLSQLMRWAGLHLGPDIVVLRLVEGALHPIEQSTCPAEAIGDRASCRPGRPRGDRRRDRRRARVCRARADGRRLMKAVPALAMPGHHRLGCDLITDRATSAAVVYQSIRRN